MIEYLNEIEKQGIMVSRWRLEWTRKVDDIKAREGLGLSLQNFVLEAPLNYALEHYLNSSKADYYIVQDSDISLESAPSDIIVFYQGIMKLCPNLYKVAPHIMISDIPLSYKWRDIIYDTYAMYWKTIPFAAKFNEIYVHLYPMGTDTHWSLQRSHNKFMRLAGTGIRTYAPYACQHLDFYDTEEYPDTAYYKKLDEYKLNHYTVSENATAPSRFGAEPGNAD